MALGLQQKKDYALLLYLQDNLDQNVIAERVGVTPKTISKWKLQYNWEDQKANIVITRKETLARTYRQITQIYDALETEDRRINNKEADTLSKLAATVRSLENEVGVDVMIDVFMKFGKWLMEADYETAVKFVQYQDTYIKERLSR